MIALADSDNGNTSIETRRPVGLGGRGNLACQPRYLGGAVMQRTQAFIIPAILALGVAGSALVSSAIPAAANVPVVHVGTTGLSTGANMYHHG